MLFGFSYIYFSRGRESNNFGQNIIILIWAFVVLLRALRICIIESNHFLFNIFIIIKFLKNLIIIY